MLDLGPGSAVIRASPRGRLRFRETGLSEVIGEQSWHLSPSWASRDRDDGAPSPSSDEGENKPHSSHRFAG